MFHNSDVMFQLELIMEKPLTKMDPRVEFEKFIEGRMLPHSLSVKLFIYNPQKLAYHLELMCSALKSREIQN